MSFPAITSSATGGGDDGGGGVSVRGGVRGGGIVVRMSGSEGEATEVTALGPLVVEGSSGGSGAQAQKEWVVHVQRVTFDASGKFTIAFHH